MLLQYVLVAHNLQASVICSNLSHGIEIVIVGISTGIQRQVAGVVGGTYFSLISKPKHCKRC